jgi:hypothetical protein
VSCVPLRLGVGRRGEGRFEDVSVVIYHAIVGRFVNFAEVCSGLGKASIENSHEGHELSQSSLCCLNSLQFLVRAA